MKNNNEALQNVINEFQSKRNMNPFYRSPDYQVNVRVSSFNTFMSDMNAEFKTHLESTGDVKSSLALAVPDFQRDNDKWSLSKKVKFIENVLAGFISTVYLYEIKSKNASCLADSLAKVLDGLQRLTSLVEFTNNEFPIFGGFYYDDIKSGAVMGSPTIAMRQFTFETEEDACRFYIDLNDGNTHSKSDIKRATDHLSDLTKSK